MVILGMRSLWFAVVTSIQLFGAIINWNTNMCWKFLQWTVSIITLPIRALGALRREKMLERLLREMQNELENLSWDNEKLTAHLKLAVKEHRLMESMLSEIEDEHDKAIDKIESLEKQVEQLKDENIRLKEVQSKGFWDSADNNITRDEKMTSDPDKYNIHESPWQSRKTAGKGNNLLENFQLPENFLRQPSTAVDSVGLVDPLTPLIFSSNVNSEVALDQRREVALSQSLFSALLSLLVGLIIWEAKDPCMPLVLALFSVVGLSLRSVVQFFSTIRNRPASDAVALLSFNWFILGTLSYPTLPKVAHMLFPVFASFFKQEHELSSL